MKVNETTELQLKGREEEREKEIKVKNIIISIGARNE
jgi:hypothetical protein